MANVDSFGLGRYSIDSEESVDAWNNLVLSLYPPRPYQRRPVEEASRSRFRGLTEIGRELGCSREQVRLIERAALKKCRLWCERHGLKLQDLLPGLD